MVNNQKGSSLLVVLLVMTVFTIVGLSILGLNVNTSKQVNKTGSDLQATNLAEMGVTHLKEELYRIIVTNSNKTIEQLEPIIENYITVLKTQTFQLENTTSPSYSYEFRDDDPVTLDETKNKLRVSFASLGNLNYQNEISGYIEVENPFVDNFASEVSKILGEAIVNPTTLSEYLVGEKKDEYYEFEAPVYYEDGLELQGSKTPYMFLYGLYSTEISEGNKQIIMVKEIVGVEGTVTESDVYVRDKLDLFTNGNDSFMCVEGTIYFYGPEENLLPTPKIIDETCKCDDKKIAYLADEKVNGGIFARKVERLQLFTFSFDRAKIIIDAQYQ